MVKEPPRRRPRIDEGVPGVHVLLFLGSEAEELEQARGEGLVVCDEGGQRGLPDGIAEDALSLGRRRAQVEDDVGQEGLGVIAVLRNGVRLQL
jgi:hypothetical protein